MATHRQQHYIPRFLLEHWHSPPDNKLSSFRWAHGRLVNQRYTAKAVGKREHIYSMQRSSAEPDVKVERDFLGPCVDEPGALAHQALVRNGIGTLTEQRKADWARLLVSLLLRMPNMVTDLRAKASKVLKQNLEEAPEEYIEQRGDATEATLQEWAEKRYPELMNDFGVMALPELVQSSLLNQAVLNAMWTIRPLRKAPFDLLIGDNPLIYAGTLKENFLLCLPVSPKSAFLASNNTKTLEYLLNLEDKLFAREANLSTVGQAEQFIFATGMMQESFIAKHLRKSTASQEEASK